MFTTVSTMMKAMFALALVTREAYAAGGVAALACVFLVFPNILCFLSCVKWNSSVYYIIYFTGNQQNFIPCRIKTHLYAAERFFLTAGDIDGIINNKRYIVRSRKERYVDNGKSERKKESYPDSLLRSRGTHGARRCGNNPFRLLPLGRQSGCNDADLRQRLPRAVISRCSKTAPCVRSCAPISAPTASKRPR